MHLVINYPDPRLVIGLVFARALRLEPSPPPLLEAVAAETARRAAMDEADPQVQAEKDALRDLLRAAGYKPSGRGKPASEYLAQAAREGRFPSINTAVDANNLVSLESGLPISILDARAFGSPALAGLDSLSETPLLLRAGNAGERYTFNQSGHEIELPGLLCVCAVRGEVSVPLGNAVKDSMEGKLKDDSTDAIAVIYGTDASQAGRHMEKWTLHLAGMLEQYSGAECRTAICRADER